jgi:ATP-dependent 26S proteasome regulatory subunit
MKSGPVALPQRGAARAHPVSARLEPALAAHPGRVDQAVEIRLPDSDARRRLLQRYGAGVDMRLADIETHVSRTEGVTASFIKELICKAALVAARLDVARG